MGSLRPLKKELLKKMFLKVLYNLNDPDVETEPDFLSIICRILTESFNISELSETEFREILKAVNELEMDELIEQDFLRTSAKYKVLTPKGRKYVESHLLKFTLPVNEIKDLLTREDLKETCLEDYLNGDYESAILKAFRMLEEVTTAKPIHHSFLIEKELLSKSYITDCGTFICDRENPEIEIDSLHRIMLGTMLWIKQGKKLQPGFDTAEAAAQVLLFTNIHLNVLQSKEFTI